MNVEQYLGKIGLERGLRPRTVELYKLELGLLQKMWGNKEQVEEALSKCSTVTRNRKLMIWKPYLRSINETWLNDVNVYRVKNPKEAEFLEEHELDALYDYVRKNCDKEQIIFFELAFRLGLRISEILGINFETDVTENYVYVTRKGGKRKKLPCPRDLGVKLTRGFQGFTRKKRYYQYFIKKIAAECGIKRKITPHTLRHTFATVAVHAGENVITIKEALGHSSIATTQRYMHAGQEHLKKAFERIDQKMMENKNGI